MKAGFACLAGCFLVLLMAASQAPAGEAPICEELHDRATIVGTSGPDVIHGTRKDDVIFAKGGDDRIWGHGGFGDKICTGSGDDMAVGRAGQDHLFGQAGDDELIGKSAGDTFWPGPGNDLVYGDDGTVDRVSYELASGPVSVDLMTGEATGEGTDTLVSISDIEGSLFDDLLIGGPWQNEILGGRGDDEIHGMGRQDDLFGATGDDEIHGEGGDDELHGGVGLEDGLGDVGDGGADEDSCAEFESALNCEL